MFASLTSKEFREQVQSLKLDRKRRTRSARKVGGRGEMSHVTLKWEGGFRGGRAKRKEGDGEKCSTTQFFISQDYFF